MKWSLNHEAEQVHTKKRRQENENYSPNYKTNVIVLRIYNRIPQATNP